MHIAAAFRCWHSCLHGGWGKGVISLFHVVALHLGKGVMGLLHMGPSLFGHGVMGLLHMVALLLQSDWVQVHTPSWWPALLVSGARVLAPCCLASLLHLGACHLCSAGCPAILTLSMWTASIYLRPSVPHTLRATT